MRHTLYLRYSEPISKNAQSIATVFNRPSVNTGIFTNLEFNIPCFVYLLIQFRFQVEINCGMFMAWPDHDESTKNW